jgi:hypothetical protein
MERVESLVDKTDELPAGMRTAHPFQIECGFWCLIRDRIGMIRVSEVR